MSELDRGDGGGGGASLQRNMSLSRLNAQAPAFVPRSPRPVQYVPVLQYRPRGAGTQYFDRQVNPEFGGGQAGSGAGEVEEYVEPVAAPALKNGITEEAAQKIINQVEYYFSDINLATTDHLMRFINKEAEGYVPLSVVASFKKIKAAITSNSQLASILQDSAKLVVSEDGKKVKRQHPVTQSDLEELQSRIVVAENLPEDHCHQNLMKIFSAVGSVKTIRTCQPQSLNGGASSASRPGKAESMAFSNKLHAFVEYETVELAEKAVMDLNDEANWRSGLRVRLFARNTPKPAQSRGKKFANESEGKAEEDRASSAILQHQMSEKQPEDPSKQVDGQSREHIGQGEEHVNEKEGGVKKGRGRGRGKRHSGKAQSQSQYHNHNHNHHQYHNNNHQQHRVGNPPSSAASDRQPPSIISKQPPGPRMPDGTRGFTMGRGKPLLAGTHAQVQTGFGGGGEVAVAAPVLKNGVTEEAAQEIINQDYQGKSAQPKPAQPRGKKYANESVGKAEEDRASSTILQHQMSEKLEDPSKQVDGQSREHIGHGEEQVNKKEGVVKKGRGRGRGKRHSGKAQSEYQNHNYHQYHNSNHQQHRFGNPPPSAASDRQPPSIISKQPPGPRIPDGTRGFTMGRGKPLLTGNN